jgi:hypothetical protein
VFVIFPASGDRSTMATEVVTGGEDAMETGFVLSEIDTTTPHPARMHDALLGGCDQPVAGCEGRIGHPCPGGALLQWREDEPRPVRPK